MPEGRETFQWSHSNKHGYFHVTHHANQIEDKIVTRQ